MKPSLATIRMIKIHMIHISLILLEVSQNSARVFQASLAQDNKVRRLYLVSLPQH